MRNIGFIVFILVIITGACVAVNNVFIYEKQERLDANISEYEKGYEAGLVDGKEKALKETTRIVYDYGYETGALCGSKFGYDDCMYFLKETK